MKRILIIISVFFLISHLTAEAQSPTDTSVYLITCGPGTDTYSIYGHSAIRIVIPEKKTDMVYNWGVFEFDVPNFAWKFAKGRLNYYVVEQPVNQFLEGYIYERRYVISQKMNLSSEETFKLISLINNNVKPENSRYKYDFFYDDCSTRIRDLIEKSVGKMLLYPPAEKGKMPTFRKMVAKYQYPYQWLQFGIDLIMGSTSDKSASFRDRMFLPLDMQAGLSETVINRSGKMVPLLQNPRTILDFEPSSLRQNFLTSPVFAFTILLIIIIILSVWLKNTRIMNAIDISVFTVFSILAGLMIFFSFFTDHPQMKLNYNLVWLNPVIIICLLSLILKKKGLIWFRIVFYLSAAFLLLHVILPQEFELAFLLLDLVIMIRCMFRGEFSWNPLQPLTKL
jgi:hypothetical protein